IGGSAMRSWSSRADDASRAVVHDERNGSRLEVAQYLARGGGGGRLVRSFPRKPRREILGSITEPGVGSRAGRKEDERVRPGGEQDREHTRVPEGQPFSKRHAHGSSSSPASSTSAPSMYPAPRRVWMSGVNPGVSTLRRSRPMYTSSAFENGSWCSSQTWSEM